MTRTISATLPSGSLYVSGTVNSAAVTWTNTAGNTWQATAERSADDIYRIELTIISGTGQSITRSMTLYYGLHLVADRTKSDVDRKNYLAGKSWGGMSADEKTEWNAGMKGAYNAADLNRVGAAVSYVAGRLLEYGYSASVHPKQDWVMEDIPTPEQLKTYLDDVRVLRSALAVLDTTPEVPCDMEKLAYTEANNIEQILEDADAVISKMLLSFWYTGEIYCGEV